MDEAALAGCATAGSRPYLLKASRYPSFRPGPFKIRTLRDRFRFQHADFVQVGHQFGIEPRARRTRRRNSGKPQVPSRPSARSRAARTSGQRVGFAIFGRFFQGCLDVVLRRPPLDNPPCRRGSRGDDKNQNGGGQAQGRVPSVALLPPLWLRRPVACGPLPLYGLLPPPAPVPPFAAAGRPSAHTESRPSPPGPRWRDVPRAPRPGSVAPGRSTPESAPHVSRRANASVKTSQLRLPHRLGPLAGKGGLAGEDFAQDAPQSEHVGSLIHQLHVATSLLGAMYAACPSATPSA